MFDGHNWMWGMHWMWWIVWIAIAAIIVIVLVRAGRGSRPPQESSLEVLEKRYAAGEITTEDFEERRKRLQRDGT